MNSSGKCVVEWRVIVQFETRTWRQASRSSRRGRVYLQIVNRQIINAGGQDGEVAACRIETSRMMTLRQSLRRIALLPQPGSTASRGLDSEGRARLSTGCFAEPLAVPGARLPAAADQPLPRSWSGAEGSKTFSRFSPRSNYFASDCGQSPGTCPRDSARPGVLKSFFRIGGDNVAPLIQVQRDIALEANRNGKILRRGPRTVPPPLTAAVSIALLIAGVSSDGHRPLLRTLSRYNRLRHRFRTLESGGFPPFDAGRGPFAITGRKREKAGGRGLPEAVYFFHRNLQRDFALTRPSGFWKSYSDYQWERGP